MNVQSDYKFITKCNYHCVFVCIYAKHKRTLFDTIKHEVVLFVVIILIGLLNLLKACGIMASCELDYGQYLKISLKNTEATENVRTEINPQNIEEYARL